MDRSKTDIAVTKDVSGYTLFVKQETDVTKELEEAKAIRAEIGGQNTYGKSLRHLAHFPPSAITAYLHAYNVTVAEFEADKRLHVMRMMADPNLQAFVINPYFTKK
ncbi:hypothetical protein AWB76_00941 [Caballeronia temeraria]|uniref:Uncharacterized protein n=1 Tax=Caballeronia temeraria TaxID=1777137 RepID=A0A157ZM76_9BURK|nr:hypothetical protein [Caballeronia temeraria]SAK46596.1 hypothetical protein AWB76_00941 [Caballeronia temeraria]